MNIGGGQIRVPFLTFVVKVPFFVFSRSCLQFLKQPLLSDSSETWTHNHLVRKQTLNI